MKLVALSHLCVVESSPECASGHSCTYVLRKEIQPDFFFVIDACTMIVKKKMHFLKIYLSHVNMYVCKKESCIRVDFQVRIAITTCKLLCLTSLQVLNLQWQGPLDLPENTYVLVILVYNLASSAVVYEHSSETYLGFVCYVFMETAYSLFLLFLI